MKDALLVNRRLFLMGSSLAAVGALAPLTAFAAADPYANTSWRKMTDEEWKKRLPADSYAVLRHEATERPGSSPLLNEHRKGTFACLGCGLPLFESKWKFESGTGWPSFWTAIDKNLGKKADFKLIEERVEYHCARCLGHQGHIFRDGPKPTGLRYCMDGLALGFTPEAGPKSGA